MRICYINYMKNGAGPWIHGNYFITELKKIHQDVITYTPLVRRSETWGNNGDSISFLREIRLFIAMFFRQLIGELRFLKKTKPDIVILRKGRYFSGILLCRILNIPIIIEVNGPAIENKFSPKNQRLRLELFWQWLECKLMALASHIMVVSETLKQYYVTCGIPSEKITSVPNGVDIHTFNPDINGERVREQLGLQGKTVIGFSGVFAPWHGLDFLAIAIKHLAESNKHKDMVLLLVGKPFDVLIMPDFPSAITIITGHIPHEKMPEYLAAIDIFIAPYPSITPFYFSPLKIFEAMSMGKPIIASAQGQISELITDQVSGLLYTPGDQSEFIDKIELLLTDRQLRQRLGQNARKVIEKKFTWQDNAKRMLNLCKRVVGIKKA